MLQQQITVEVIAQEDASSQYHVRTDEKGHALGRPVFYTEIPVRWTKSAPAEAEIPPRATAIPGALSSRPTVPVVSSAPRPVLPTPKKPAVPVIRSNLPLPPSPRPAVEVNPFTKFKNS